VLFPLVAPSVPYHLAETRQPRDWELSGDLSSAIRVVEARDEHRRPKLALQKSRRVTKLDTLRAKLEKERPGFVGILGQHAGLDVRIPGLAFHEVRPLRRASPASE